MCGDCGCKEITENVELKTDRRKIEVNRGILSKNDRLAEQNRNLFKEQKLLVVNLLSSPGSGKTALIERMQTEGCLKLGLWVAVPQGHNISFKAQSLEEYKQHLKMGVVVGDLATDNEAQRLLVKKIPAVQITTGNACHLEANMVAQAVHKLDLNSLDLLIIENVGNLVCPAAYDLGEDLRIVLLSVTEGEDKPLKYPTMFKSAQIVIINKVDIGEAVGFDREKALANIQKIAPQARIFEVSAKTGQGIDSFLIFLFSMLKIKTSAQWRW